MKFGNLFLDKHPFNLSYNLVNSKVFASDGIAGAGGNTDTTPLAECLGNTGYLFIFVKRDGFIRAQVNTYLTAGTMLLINNRGRWFNFNLSFANHRQCPSGSGRRLSHSIRDILWPLAATSNEDTIGHGSYRVELRMLLQEETITASQVREAMKKSVRTLVNNVKDIIEATPPELVADIYKRGVLLSGGGALLKGLPDLLNKEIQVPINVADDALTTMVRGAGVENPPPSPTVTSNGSVIVVGEHAMYCVSGYKDGTLDTDAPWPKWQHDLHNTGHWPGW